MSVPPDAPPHVARIVEESERHATSLGALLEIDWQPDHDGGRIAFALHRMHGPRGSGAQALRHMLGLADAADVPVVLDVMHSAPRLVRYYWDFGFRLVSNDSEAELAEFELLEEELAQTKKRDGPEADLGVTFMWRDRGAGALQRVPLDIAA